MKNFANEEEKMKFVFDSIQNLTNEIIENGAYCFDFILDESTTSLSQRFDGKAFSVTGTDFFGFAYDGECDTFEKIKHSPRTAIFSGSFVDGKGVSVEFLPCHYINLKSPRNSFSLDVTNRPGKESLYGKHSYNNAKVTLIPTDGEELEAVVTYYIDLLAQITGEYPNKAVLLVDKAEKQEENIALINKLYEQFKGIPIPSCFKTDGDSPKTKM